jgi:hypothetical protein
MRRNPWCTRGCWAHEPVWASTTGGAEFCLAAILGSPRREEGVTPLAYLIYIAIDTTFVPSYSALVGAEMLRRARPVLSLHAAPALRRACSSGGAAGTALAGDRPSASQVSHLAAEAVRDLGSAGHDYRRAAEDRSALDDGALTEINELIRKRLDAIKASRFAEAEAFDLELRERYEVTVRRLGLGCPWLGLGLGVRASSRHRAPLF